MDNEKITKMDDQFEYQFDSSEIGNPQAPLVESTPDEDSQQNTDRLEKLKNIVKDTVKNVMKNKQLLKSLFLIFAIVMVYIIFSLMGSSRLDQHNENQFLMQEQTQNTVHNNRSAMDYTAQVLEQQQAIGTLQKELNNIVINSGKIEEEFGDFRQQIYELQQQLQILNGKVVELMDKVDKNAQAIATNKKPVKKTVKTVKHRYTVQAVLGDRAWLKDENGRTLTVEVGKQLAGYGEVTQITEKHGGLVVTSDGSLIQLEI